MESTLHDDNILATELSEDEVASMTYDSALGELFNLLILDGGLVSDNFSQGAQSGTADDGDLRGRINLGLEEINNRLNGFVGSHSSEVVLSSYPLV